MSKIDYDAYLKGLGNINTSQADCIKQYLEEQCKTDDALKAVYNPDKIGDCYQFITDCARKMNGNGAVLEDVVVFKMARDYFIEILPTLKEEKKEEPVVEVTPVQETVKEASAKLEEEVKKDDVKRTALGFEIYGEESEEPEEEAEQPEEPCHQEEVGEKEPVIYEGEGEDEIVQTIVEDDCITVTGRPKTEEEKAAEKPRYDEEGNGLLFDFM